MSGRTSGTRPAWQRMGHPRGGDASQCSVRRRPSGRPRQQPGSHVRPSMLWRHAAGGAAAGTSCTAGTAWRGTAQLTSAAVEYSPTATVSPKTYASGAAIHRTCSGTQVTRGGMGGGGRSAAPHRSEHMAWLQSLAQQRQGAVAHRAALKHADHVAKVPPAAAVPLPQVEIKHLRRGGAGQAVDEQAGMRCAARNCRLWHRTVLSRSWCAPTVRSFLRSDSLKSSPTSSSTLGSGCRGDEGARQAGRACQPSRGPGSERLARRRRRRPPSALVACSTHQLAIQLLFDDAVDAAEYFRPPLLAGRAAHKGPRRPRRRQAWPASCSRNAQLQLPAVWEANWAAGVQRQQARLQAQAGGARCRGGGRRAALCKPGGLRCCHCCLNAM